MEENKEHRELLAKILGLPDGSSYNSKLATWAEIYVEIGKSHEDTLIANTVKQTLEEVEKKYIDALIWCSGSDDFQIEGKARKGWEKICLPLINKS